MSGAVASGAADPSDDKRAQRLYGRYCLGSNLLLCTVGHDMTLGAGISIVAQVGNSIFDKPVKRVTTPLLILSGAAFVAAGVHAGMTWHDAAPIGFGLCKMAGITILFFGKDLGKRAKDSPGLRMVGRVLRQSSGPCAEALLALGASSLAAGAVIDLVEHKWIEGTGKLVSMGLFVTGNHIRAGIPQSADDLRGILGKPADAETTCRFEP